MPDTSSCGSVGSLFAWIHAAPAGGPSACSRARARGGCHRPCAFAASSPSRSSGTFTCSVAPRRPRHGSTRTHAAWARAAVHIHWRLVLRLCCNVVCVCCLRDTCFATCSVGELPFRNQTGASSGDARRSLNPLESTLAVGIIRTNGRIRTSFDRHRPRHGRLCSTFGRISYQDWPGLDQVFCGFDQS